MDDGQDAPYPVPSHLGEGQSIGPIPVRTFFVLLSGAILLGAPLALAGYSLLGTGGAWVGFAVGLAIASPFGMPWLRPSAEHGALAALRWFAENAIRRWRAIPPEMALDVSVDGDIVYVPVGNFLEPRAVYRILSTVNLATASAGARRAVRARWGGLVNALTYPVQILVVARSATTLEVVERIRGHATVEAQDLAAWLTEHLRSAELVDRDRYLVVPAEDTAQLTDRCTEYVEPSFAERGILLERVIDGSELREIVGLLDDGRPIGATFMRVGEELVRSFDLGETPPMIVTDWARPLLDGDLAVNASVLIEPQNMAWAKAKLDMRLNAIGSSQLTPGRVVAADQIAKLRMAYENHATAPMRMTCTLQIRAGDRRTLERRTKRFKQKVKDMGAQARLLRWEQHLGYLNGLVGAHPSPNARGMMTETGTVARTYPFSSSRLQLEDGVPFGVSGSTPVTFTVVQPRRVGRKGWRHMVWYGAPGSGKGFQLKVYLSREHFANGLRIYGIDQDEQGEYTGRFCRYLHGSTVVVRTVEDALGFSFDDVENPDVVMWDLHESEEDDRGRIFAALSKKLIAHLLATSGRAALIVDEAVTVTEDEAGAKALGVLNRRGRHFGVEMHVLTQRVTDWFDTKIGRTIQGTSANQWYGQLEDRELDDMQRPMKLSDEEVERIKAAGQGQGLLVTAGQRVWVTVYGHTSPGEFAAFNTDKDDEEQDDAEVVLPVDREAAAEAAAARD